MARIQTPQHVQELQAEFKIREQFGLELLETVQPTYQLGRQKIASTGYPRKCSAILIGGNTASTNSELILTCPADIGIVILVEQIWIPQGPYRIHLTDGVAPASVTSVLTTKAFRDARIIDQLPDGIIEEARPLTAAPNGRPIAAAAVPTGDTLIFKPEIILGGGAYVLVRNDTVNDAFTISFLWTEFLLEDR